MNLRTLLFSNFQRVLMSLIAVSFITASDMSWATTTDAELRQLRVSVRFGDDGSGANVSISSRDPNAEHSVRIAEGERAVLAMRQAGASPQSGRTGGRVETNTVLALVANVSGKVATVKFSSVLQTGSSNGRQSSIVDSSLSLPLGVWTEVSGRGPWSGASSSTISSRDASGSDGKVYLKVDEVNR